MDVTFVIIALIVGFVVITVFSLVALLFVRRRERERERLDSQHIAKTIEDLDTALDSALSEINKLGALIQAEVDEKYKSILFLYNLVEDKQKEIAESADSAVISEMLAQYVEKHGAQLKLITEASVAQISSVAASQKAAVAVAASSSNNVSNLPDIEGDNSNTAVAVATPHEFKKRPKFSNPKHKQIWEMRQKGQEVPEIAKELGIGQGEVKLILDMVDRAS
ncbi:MAG: hypothetical protein FWC89_01975 [Defluviitaleaceae bacterium]|nr:hypothetical protein [Defluviitaleaceae bacterium]